jgi:hypothetical protein
MLYEDASGTKMAYSVSCLDLSGGKIHSHVLSHREVARCVHESLAAVHQPSDMYFQTELFVIADRKGRPLFRIRNCEDWTTERAREVQIHGIRKVEET